MISTTELGAHLPAFATTCVPRHPPPAGPVPVLLLDARGGDWSGSDAPFPPGCLHGGGLEFGDASHGPVDQCALGVARAGALVASVAAGAAAVLVIDRGRTFRWVGQDVRDFARHGVHGLTEMTMQSFVLNLKFCGFNTVHMVYFHGYKNP